MQQGLFLLWALSLGASVLALLYLEISLVRNGKFKSHRQLTGGDLARQILDRNHLNRMTIGAVSVRRTVHFGVGLDRFLLRKKVYYGSRLADLAVVLHETAHLLEESHALIPLEWRAKSARMFQGIVGASLLFILTGLFLAPLGWLSVFGQGLFVIVFFIALVSLGEEAEITERALTNLSLLEGFGTDERVRIRRLLKALRWSPIAELLRNLCPIKI